VTWEDTDRPPLDVFFEVDSRIAPELEPDANALLLAGILPAFRNGERRLRIDGDVCPLLCEGLETAMTLQRSWYGGSRRTVVIEAAGRRASPRRSARAGLFLTGGVDSVHALWWNRGAFPSEHPAAFRDAVTVEGLSFPEATPSARNQDVTRRQGAAVAAVASESGLEVVGVRTNIRLLEPDPDFLAREGLSVLLASVGHALSRRTTYVSFGAVLDRTTLIPRGSHPLLDACFCSSALEFRQEDWTIDRLTKIRRIAGWRAAVENLMVCFEGPLADGRLNCGQCEKCLRTVAGLWIAFGRPEAPSFPEGALTAEAIDRIEPAHHLDILPDFWSQFVEPFRTMGRRDLSRACRRLADRARRRLLRSEGRGWTGAARRFDREHLHGVVRRAARRIRGVSGAV
jgi:hypothetical protein